MHGSPSGSFDTYYGIFYDNTPGRFNTQFLGGFLKKP